MSEIDKFSQINKMSDKKNKIIHEVSLKIFEDLKGLSFSEAKSALNKVEFDMLPSIKVS